MNNIELWKDEAWQYQLCNSVADDLKSLGIECARSFSSIRIMPWSFVGELKSESATYYVKCVPTSTSFEPALTNELSLLSDNIVKVVLAKSAEGVLVTKGETAYGDDDSIPFQDLLCAVRHYAKLQKNASEHKSVILATGIPQLALKPITLRYETLLARYHNLPVDHPSHIDSKEMNKLLRASGKLLVAESRLKDSGIAMSVDHGDMLVKNILLSNGPGAKEYKWYDFGDASWYYPFCTMDMLCDRRFYDLTESESEDLKDAYLIAWASENNETEITRLRSLLSDSITISAVRRAEVRVAICEITSADDMGDLAAFPKNELTRSINML